MCFLNHTDGLLFPPLLSPLPLTTPPHHSDPTHPSSHHSPLSLLFTPLTPIHTNALPPLPHYSSLLPLASLHPLTTPVTTPSRYPSPLLTYPPHHTSSHPLYHSPPYLASSPHLLTTLFTTPLLTLLRLLTTPSPLLSSSLPTPDPSSPPLFKGTS